MAEPLDVARHLIWLAANEDEPDYLTHLQVQKLLYYVQGWHLAVFGRPLFAGRIEAWTHGPVVRELYPKFTDHGYRPIPPECGTEATSLTAAQRAFVAAVWEKYKPYSAIGLRDMTHREPPWRDARRGLAPDERCDAEITPAALQGFFAGQFGEVALPGVDAAEVYDAIDELDRGGGREHTDVFARLRGRT